MIFPDFLREAEKRNCHNSARKACWCCHDPEVRHFITEALRIPYCFVCPLFAILWRCWVPPERLPRRPARGLGVRSPHRTGFSRSRPIRSESGGGLVGLVGPT
jgi:hypothetical protein